MQSINQYSVNITALMLKTKGIFHMENFEHWLAVNEHGDCAISFDSAEDAVAILVDEHGGSAYRTARIAVAMALPVALEADEIELGEDEDGVEIEEGEDGEFEEEAPELPELLPEEASPKAPAEPAVAA